MLVHTIYDDCGEAIKTAAALAAWHETQFTVWRCGDEFVALADGISPTEAWPIPTMPIRPVASYDQDGTEHC